MTDDVARETQAGARASPFGVSGNSRSNSGQGIIDAALRAIVPSGRHAELVALFRHRYQWDAIRSWRRGRATPPQWAREIIAERLAVHAELERRVRAMRPRKRGSHFHGLLLWHAQRRAEKLARQANEKAGD